MVPFCDPVGWVESFGPVLGPVLAALSVVAYPAYLIYQSLLLASQVGQLNLTLGPAVGQAIGQVLLVLFIIAVVVILAAVAVGVAFLGCVTGLLAVMLRRLLEPTPVNEPWVPRRGPGRGVQVG